MMAQSFANILSPQLYARWVHLGCRLRQPQRFQRYQQKRLAADTDASSYSYKPFDDTRSIFVHIPKCAGTSIVTSLYGCLAGGHTTFEEYLTVFEPENINAYFKFTVVRNPWDRLVSAFHFLKAGGANDKDRLWAEKELSLYESFDDFARHWLCEENIWKYHHFRPQNHYLTVGNRKLTLDFIARFENLEADFGVMAKKLGKNCALPQVNSTDRSSYQQYYNPKTADIVANVYAEDIKLLEYSFDVE